MDEPRETPYDSDPRGEVDMPPDTGPNPPAMPGTSEGERPVQGIYRPDVGPGGRDIDTGERALPGRGRIVRGGDATGAQGPRLPAPPHENVDAEPTDEH